MLCLVAQSCPILCDSIDCSLPGSSVYGDSPGKNTGMGRHSLFQGIIPKQGSNPGLLHCRLILYHLSHQGSPRILECIAYPFLRGSSWPRNWTRVSCITGGFFTSWATREAQIKMWWEPVSEWPRLTHSFHLLNTRILILLQLHFGKSLPDCFLEPRCLSFLFAPHI